MTSKSAGATTKLGDLLTNLAVFDLVCAPGPLDAVVSEPVIHDPVSPPEIAAGAVVLAVGVEADSREARDLIKRAARAHAVAVAFKLDASDAPGELHDAAHSAGVVVLGVPREMTWSQAHSLMRTALAGTTHADADDVPLGDLFALANAIAASVGGAVTIEDRASNVLAYSSQTQGVDEPRRETILGRKVPDEWLGRLEEAGVFKRLWAGEVIRYEAPSGFDLRPRVAVAVTAGDTILGSIWVAEADKPLGAEAESVLRESARIAALHLVRHRATEDLERTARGELLTTILEGRAGVDAVAYRLGIPATSTFAVLAFEAIVPDDAGAPDLGADALTRERVLDLVTLYGEAFRNRSASVRLGRAIYVLLPGADADRSGRLVQLAFDIIDTAQESLGVRLRAGVGSVVSHLREVPRSRREADQVLRALSTDPDAPAASDFSSSRSQVTMVELRDFVSEHPHVRSQRISALVSHDAQHGTCYIETLQSYLDCFGDIPEAAKLGNVHPNTFRYRLRRLLEVSGLDLDDPDERLLAALELRLGPATT